MARKSRKGNKTLELCSKIFNTAIYARLSSEDNNDSLSNQVDLVKEYILEKPYLKLIDVYEDKGTTGTNFQRPEFQRLLKDIKAGKINCIAVKDLSRFGRSYIEIGHYLENIFPCMGIRFISVNDFFDNYKTDNDGIIVSLKNLVNDFYAKDISRKTISALETKRRSGEYVGGLAPYGYQKSNNKLVIDHDVVDIVRLIFKWKAIGDSDTVIARKLNDLAVPCPAKRKIELGYVKGNTRFKHYIWRDRTIRDITTNQVYMGTLCQGKTKQALFLNRPAMKQPYSEWIVIRDSHEPVIDKELWYQAQKARTSQEKKGDLNV